MSLFHRKHKPKAGGTMDVIRCDKPSYLIWKWHPEGSEQGNNNRENAIRFGSSLRVKDGEVAVFVYKQKDGTMQDYIEGPFDKKISTKNLPILASLVGAAYAGDSPFQAEIYFINLAQMIQIPFGVPYFDLYDPRFQDFGVPTAVRGRISFHVTDYKQFIKLHRLIDFNLEEFLIQIRDAVSRYVKSAVTNAPAQHNIPAVQIERNIEDINNIVQENIAKRFAEEFGVTVTSVDVSEIELDKTSDGYKQLLAVTRDVSSATVKAQTEAGVKDIHDMQRVNAEHTQGTLRMQREEAQYAQHKATQTGNLEAFKIETQGQVGIAGAEALGKMNANNASNVPTSGGGLNMAGVMTGMALGGAVGRNIAKTMDDMMKDMQQPPKVGPAPEPPLNRPSPKSPEAEPSPEE